MLPAPQHPRPARAARRAAQRRVRVKTRSGALGWVTKQFITDIEGGARAGPHGAVLRAGHARSSAQLETARPAERFEKVVAERLYVASQEGERLGWISAAYVSRLR